MNDKNFFALFVLILFPLLSFAKEDASLSNDFSFEKRNCLSFVFIPSNYNGKAISCSDANDGSLTVNAFGGTAPYSYLWNDGDTGFEKTDLSAGNYSVTVSDANGCSFSSSINLQAPSPIIASASVVSNYNGNSVSCINANDGIAVVSISGGTAPFEYEWDNGNKFANADDLSCGVHLVTITDANGCSAIASANLICPSPLNVNVTINSDHDGFHVSCPEANDGGAQVTVQNGIAPFQYQWSSGETTAQSNNLIAGTNGVTVSDALGCSIVSFIELSAPNEMQTFVSVLSDYDGEGVSCAGAEDGSAAVSAFGGGIFYTYLWDNGETTQTATQLSAGMHEVTVTNSAGCSVVSTVEITAYEISIEPIIPTDYNGAAISCNGANDGSIQMNVEAGASSPPAVTYLWNTGDTEANLENISAGTYTLTVTSDFGCSATTEVIINEPTAIEALATVQSDYNGYHVSINGFNDGHASIVATGGTTTALGDYNFIWENSLTGNVNTELNGGKQNVSVTDANGCEFIIPLELTQPPALVGIADVESDYRGQDISCTGEDDGSAIVITSGGVPPYTYEWSNNATTEIVEDLEAGRHQVTVTDLNGATAVSEVTLYEPDPISLSMFSTPTSNPPNGTTKVEVSGGTVPYWYQWNDEFGRETQSIEDLKTGWYRVTVTDANGCQETDQVEVVQSNEILCVKENMTITPNGDGKNDLLNLSCIHPFPNELEIFDRWGNVIFKALDYDGSWNIKKGGQDIPTGGYFYLLSVALPDGKRTMKGSLTIIR